MIYTTYIICRGRATFWEELESLWGLCDGDYYVARFTSENLEGIGLIHLWEPPIDL